MTNAVLLSFKLNYVRDDTFPFPQNNADIFINITVAKHKRTKYFHREYFQSDSEARLFQKLLPHSAETLVHYSKSSWSRSQRVSLYRYVLKPKRYHICSIAQPYSAVSKWVVNLHTGLLVRSPIPGTSFLLFLYWCVNYWVWVMSKWLKKPYCIILLIQK